MTSFAQIQANRLNALRSTGPKTADGKQRSRCNAVRHGLTAETVIGGLEDADDYQQFEESVTAGYAPVTAIERELVLRLASLLWRLRRANLIEAGLFESNTERKVEAAADFIHDRNIPADPMPAQSRKELTRTFLQMVNLPNSPLDRLSRYELALWQQTRQILTRLHSPVARKSHHRLF